MCLALSPATAPSDEATEPIDTSEESEMGKYFLAWLLGVPAFVLVIIYLLFN
jgi:hypothetical protein